MRNKWGENEEESREGSEYKSADEGKLENGFGGKRRRSN
jgi:hypothetical protein